VEAGEVSLIPRAQRSPSKYRAQPTWVDGIRFASKKEARRYAELLLLVKVGEIENVQVQPAYPITLNGCAICVYKADYRYFDKKAQGWVIEDVKGMKTPVYRLKKRLVEAQYGIRITEV
jgi:hypothetical protein